MKFLYQGNFSNSKNLIVTTIYMNVYLFLINKFKVKPNKIL